MRTRLRPVFLKNAFISMNLYTNRCGFLLFRQIYQKSQGFKIYELVHFRLFWPKRVEVSKNLDKKNFLEYAKIIGQISLLRKDASQPKRTIYFNLQMELVYTHALCYARLFLFLNGLRFTTFITQFASCKHGKTFCFTNRHYISFYCCS